MEVSLRCHNTPRQNGWQSASDVTHRERAEVCGESKESQSWNLTLDEDDRLLELADARWTCAFWGPLETGAKWIRQHRRLCLSSLCRNLKLKVNKKVSYLNKKSLRVFEFRDSYVLYIVYSNEHYMSISHIVLIVNMVHKYDFFKLLLFLNKICIQFIF